MTRSFVKVYTDYRHSSIEDQPHQAPRKPKKPTYKPKKKKRRPFKLPPLPIPPRPNTKTKVPYAPYKSNPPISTPNSNFREITKPNQYNWWGETALKTAGLLGSIMSVGKYAIPFL